MTAPRPTLPPDYHMHTPLCRHAEGEPVEYARHAVSLGLTEIGFSDHSPMMRDDFDNWRMRLDQLDEYVEKVARARRECPGLAIRIGLEVDFVPGHEEWIRSLSARHPWDYFIGSVHYIGDLWAIDSPANIPDWRKRDVWEIWAAYFELLTAAAESRLFEIIGHPDLPKKFGFRPARDCTPLYEPFLDAARRGGSALDINTAGLRKDCREIYPSADFLRLARAERVPITFGSDAHEPEQVGMNFTEAMALARGAGYTESLRFAGRRGISVPF